jgi:peptidyl-prolyl cis-trans isomerase B (cyclophilin B)
MPNKRARERHLAKLAAERAAGRSAYDRYRRNLALVIAGSLVAVVIALIVGITIGGHGKVAIRASASKTQQASTSPTASPQPKKTGTVPPPKNLPKTVACGGGVPASAKKPHAQYSNVPPVTAVPSKIYLATIQTSCGSFTVKLDPAGTPIATSNFIFLAKQGFYDGTWFHRIAPGFVIQGGDPEGTGSGGPGYMFTVETNPTIKFANSAGVMAYANSGANSNGSQFFVTLTKQPNLDSGGPYTAFGKVISGMSVVQRIGKVPTKVNPAPGLNGEKSLPLQAVYVERVTIKTKPKPSPAPSASASPSKSPKPKHSSGSSGS